MRLEICYSELSTHNLLDELTSYDEIKCRIETKHADLLQRSWKKYDSYALAFVENKSNFIKKIRAIKWFVSRFYVDSKYHGLDSLTEVYVSCGNTIEPIAFESAGDNDVDVYIKRK